MINLCVCRNKHLLSQQTKVFVAMLFVATLSVATNAVARCFRPESSHCSSLQCQGLIVNTFMPCRTASGLNALAVTYSPYAVKMLGQRPCAGHGHGQDHGLGQGHGHGHGKWVVDNLSHESGRRSVYHTTMLSAFSAAATTICICMRMCMRMCSCSIASEFG